MAGESRADGTRVVHAGLPPAAQGEPFLPGPQLSAPFHLSGDPHDSPFAYTRYGNPTWQRYEEALSELDGGEATLFASGMAAATAVLLSSLMPGDRVVIAADCYMAVRNLANDHLAPRGIEVEFVPTVELSRERVGAGARMLWIETPSNPVLEVCDVAALSAAGADRPAIVVVDNTLATPIGQRPLELGADVSMVSATKHLSGHADVMLGYASTRDPELAQRLRGWRTTTGSIPGPFEAWLGHRSLATLEVRLQRGCSNALAIAELLDARDDIVAVRYPGLASDPSHALAAKQMTHFGSVVSFDLGSQARAEAFLSAAELVIEATSFGGVHTSAERRGRWGGDAVSEGFVRLSAGIETPADLLDDIAGVLDTLPAV